MLGLAPEIPEDLYMLIKKVIVQNLVKGTAHNVLIIALGRRCPQAPRTQPQGQGLEVPAYFDRIAHPPLVEILQDRWGTTADVEV